MIKLSNIKKVYHNGDIYSVALGGINLEVKKGEFVAIMGPSGCGKTTLLNILGLLDNPTEGNYLLDDEDVSRMKESHRTSLRKGKIGFVFQNFNLIDELNVKQNVELPPKYMGVSATECHDKVTEVLRCVNLSHRMLHYPNQLSGGQQQRVSIARTVVCKPKLILADEPTGNLDTKNGKEIMELLTKLNDEGTTIVFVTHSLRDASYANRIVNMLDGFIVNKTEL